MWRFRSFGGELRDACIAPKMNPKVGDALCNTKIAHLSRQCEGGWSHPADE